MIRAQITTNGWNNPNDEEAWLVQHVGQRARESDQVDESRPWGAKYQFGLITYYFAREEDATMFRLRWA